MGQVVTLPELVERRRQWREQNKNVILTNGCFDLLHVGHTRYLRQAKQLGDILVVGVNTDASVRALKGERRPIVSENERAELLAALACVDYVVLFTEKTAETLVRAVKPDIYVKGGDYSPEDLPEAAAVRETGGQIQILPFVEGESTTSIVEKIVRGYKCQ